MKLTTRGFTLVELMIVIAIIGILAATLFPSLTSYLARGRDTARASNLKEYSTAVAAYMLDNSNVAPINATDPDCAPTLAVSYLPKVPKDPIATKLHGACGIAGAYGYGTGVANTIDTVAFSAAFENPKGGNTGTLTSYQGTISATNMVAIDSFQKASGSGYVIRN